MRVFQTLSAAWVSFLKRINFKTSDILSRCSHKNTCFKSRSVITIRMKKTVIFGRSVLAALGLCCASAFAISPPFPTANIPWDADPDQAGNQALYSTVTHIQNAFNNGRRVEEGQWGLTANALGSLIMPAQDIWDAMTDSEKALLLTNAERTARDGITYPNHGQVTGVPFEGVESHLEKLAQDYVNYMVTHNFWDHGVPTSVTAPPFAGSSSFNRISGHPVIGDGAGTNEGDCRQFVNAAENLSVFASSSSTNPIPMVVERSVYLWLYDDAGSAWGHRRPMLLDEFNNDRGSNNHEGFMAIAVAGKTDGTYTVFDGGRFPNQQAAVWLVFDPTNDAGCKYGARSDKILPDDSWRIISLPANPPAEANTVEAIFGDDIVGAYNTEWAVFAFDEESNDYINPGLQGVLVPGEGYWIIQKTGEPVTLDMPVGSTRTTTIAASTCSQIGGCFTHSLIAKTTEQWNMLGNPFYASPSVDKLRISTTVGACADSDACSFAEATAGGEESALMQDQFFVYTGTGYSDVGPGDSFDAWDGYFNRVSPNAAGSNPILRIPRN